MVFARKSDANLVALVKGLDEAVAKNSDKQLRAFVNILSADKDKAEATAKALATESKSANVPLVVPVEFENGPDNYGISPKAEVTVLLCVGGKVKANQSGPLTSETVQAVLKAVPSLIE
jgi:ribosomal protein L18